MKNSLDIDRIAFLGRTYAEYMDMFGLNKQLLRQERILDCPAGASSFTAEAYMKGIDVTACDIMYNLNADELLEKGRKDIWHVFEKFDEVSHRYTWDYYKNKEDVMTLRKRTLDKFSRDYSKSSSGARYIQAELPSLPFADGTFSLVLSGHFLFLYNDRLDFNFHKMCLKDLVRVCSGEIRIFPLVGLDANPYPYMDEVFEFLRTEGINFEILNAPFEFLRGANQILKLNLN